ncbi:arginase family protein, partial [Desertihabitans aurantiacus]|uniref:arginase family protein n=1 Tax=Desertihabitans aurantiacus TaxID=2282477 RepID=UPI000DF7DA08
AAAAPLLAPGSRLLALGGSCTVAVGMCAAARRAGHRPRLVYVDRHLDLNTPASTTEGSLSWMGVAHCLDVPGAAPELAHLDGAAPLLRPADLVHLGVQLSETTAGEREQRDALGLRVVDQDELVRHPDEAASAALAVLSEGPFLVHLDVDVLDFLDAPLAENVNGRNSGPTLTQLEVALARLWQHPDCLGLSVGQLVPAHAAADPPALDRFVATLVGAATADAGRVQRGP